MVFKHPHKSVRLLGLNIDDNLNWKEIVRLMHISNMKVTFTLCMTKRLIGAKSRTHTSQVCKSWRKFKVPDLVKVNYLNSCLIVFAVPCQKLLLRFLTK